MCGRHGRFHANLCPDEVALYASGRGGEADGCAADVITITVTASESSIAARSPSFRDRSPIAHLRGKRYLPRSVEAGRGCTSAASSAPCRKRRRHPDAPADG